MKPRAWSRVGLALVLSLLGTSSAALVADFELASGSLGIGIEQSVKKLSYPSHGTETTARGVCLAAAAGLATGRVGVSFANSWQANLALGFLRGNYVSRANFFALSVFPVTLSVSVSLPDEEEESSGEDGAILLSSSATAEVGGFFHGGHSAIGPLTALEVAVTAQRQYGPVLAGVILRGCLFSADYRSEFSTINETSLLQAGVTIGTR